MKSWMCVGGIALLVLAGGCKDDAADEVDANNGAANNGDRNNGDDNNGGTNNGNRPDPGPTGNNERGPECEVPTDCDQPLPLGCQDGRWNCVSNQCRAECDSAPCDYVCNIDCECKLDDRGCDIAECAEACDDVAADMEAAQQELRVCDVEDDTCSVVVNHDCAVAGDCYLLVSSSADPEPLRLARIRFNQSRCLPGEACECEEPPTDAVCIGGLCKLVGDNSCEAPEDCEGLAHDECEGAWACDEGACAWECEGEEILCEDIAEDVVSAREAVAACDEEDTCIATLNPLCGGVGDCYYYHTADADLTEVQAHEGSFMDGDCVTADCDCGEAPPVGCVDGACVAIPD